MGQRSEAAIEISASPEEVFEWLVDPVKADEWLQTSATWYPADRSELRVGYTASEPMMLPRSDGSIVRTATEVEITAYDPPREFASSSRNPSVEVGVGYRLIPSAKGTRVEGWMQTDYLGEMGAVMEMPAAAEKAKTMQDEGYAETLARLKTLVEGTPP